MLYREERVHCELIAGVLQTPDMSAKHQRAEVRAKLSTLIWYYCGQCWKPKIERVEIPTFIFEPMRWQDYGDGPVMSLPEMSANDIIITTSTGRETWTLAIHPSTGVVRTNAFGHYGRVLEEMGKAVIKRLPKYYDQIERLIMAGLRA